MTIPNTIHLGDCLEVLKRLPDAYADCVVTDPPYGLGSKQPTLDEILAYLQGSSLNTGGDFMGHDWQVPPVAVWQECFRVLKPGGHLLSFAGTRTMHIIAMGIQVAGFDCRDTVATQFGTTVLSYLYGQGFPKSLNIAKALEKAGAPPEVVEKWRGWGTALKPAWEPVLVFRKPIEGTVVVNVLENGVGVLNIDGTRTNTEPRSTGHKGDQASSGAHGRYGEHVRPNQQRDYDLNKPSGRWPANVLFVHSHGCKVVGSKKVPAPVINRFDDGMKPFGDGAGHAYTSEQTGDADGMEEIPIYECADGCPVKLLDDQSDVTTSTGGRKANITPSQVYGGGKGIGSTTTLTADAVRGDPGFGDTGGASRFFGQIQPEAPFFYTSKVSKAERNNGVVSRFFREGMVVLSPDLGEDDFETVQESWPETLPSPFVFQANGDLLQLEKASIPETLLPFFADVTKQGNPHPTMKPLALMQWLVKLVAPKGAVVLDPYCGSGTTCIAALDADCQYIGIERDPKFHEVATRRLEGLRAEIETRADDRRARETFHLMFELEQE